MSEPTAHLLALRSSTADLIKGLSSLHWSDGDVAGPSLCTGWTRGHVLTHIARNADAVGRTFAGALRGEVVARYPDGPAGRGADIEAGAGRSAVELLADVGESADRLDRLCGALTDASAWDRPVDGDRPASGWIRGRWNEVEIHRADLGGTYGAADWPASFVSYLLTRLAGRVGARSEAALRIEVAREGSTTTDLGGTVWTSGGRDPVPVRGPDWALLAWLAGRPSLAGNALSAVPELAPWS